MESSLVATEPSALVLAYVAGAFGVAGTVVGAAATLIAARWTARHQHALEQASIFRAAFVAALIALRHGDRDVYQVLTDSIMAEHERAKTLFEPWIAPRKRSEFADAWIQHTQGILTQAPGSLRNRPEECSAAIHRIERLLSFGASGA